MRGAVDRLYYDRIASTYDERHTAYDLERRIETLLAALGDIRGRLLLDAGCGTGHLSAAAAAAGARVIALDIAAGMLALTGARVGARLVRGDILHLPFRTGAFDFVLSSEVVEHVGTPLEALAEIVRVAAPGGRVAVSTPNRLWRWSVEVARLFGLRRFAGPEDWLSRRALRRALEGAGLRIEGHVGIHLLPFQIAPLRPLLRRLDRWGRVLGPLCINQAAWGVKRDA